MITTLSGLGPTFQMRRRQPRCTRPRRTPPKAAHPPGDEIRLRQCARVVIVGQDQVIEQLLVCLFSRGHCILEGVPGLAKTLLIRTLSQCLSLDFNRIQFTPDLMPSDITGTDVMYEDRNTGDFCRTFRFIKGPLFANVVLAGTRSTAWLRPKRRRLSSKRCRNTRSPPAEIAMHCPIRFSSSSATGKTPSSREGTYPLPEAAASSIDFLLKIFVGYPS